MAFFEAEIQVCGDEIGETAGVFSVEDGDLDLIGCGGGEVDNFLEGFLTLNCLS